MNNPFERVDTLELLDRYNFLIKKYAELALEIAPKLDKFGKYKEELEGISSEFIKRGVKPEDPQSLTTLIEEELKKREQQPDGQPQFDKT